VRLVETSKFKKLRKKIKGNLEKQALKESILKILDNPTAGKKLKGEFQDLRSFSYSVKGQNRRLIYKYEKDCLVLLSFGLREGIYK
jgi:mRNA-degrading endonuclease YafQ of YafQ-DinJ toxin-antitoxin module